LRGTFRGGNNVLSADGRLLAYRRELVKDIYVPGDMIANDMFTYFCCLSKGWKYRYIETAVVNFRSPQNIKDQIRQNTRFIAAPMRMERFFDANLVRRERNIPLWLILKPAVSQFIRHPIMCSYIFLINRYCKLRAYLTEKRMHAKWDMAFSTKQEIK
jgi:cellulose synthase/poly-beta-1,6-N-acetylglucosamine synthase-like glycosyltransferase